MPPFRSLIASIVLLIPAIILYGLCASWWITYFRSSSWTEVPARVVKAERSVNQGSVGQQPTLHVELAYAYTMAGRACSSESIWIIGGCSSNEEKAQVFNQMDSARRENRSITVLVNPNHPEVSLVTRTVDIVFNVVLGIALILTYLVYVGIASALGLRRLPIWITVTAPGLRQQ